MLMKVETKTFDAVVVGAGITGMYQVYELRRMGFTVQGYEGGSDVGGTWYWNRYPGCRLDTESYAYGYFALTGIIPDWKWSERFAGQPEMLRYINHAADKMDIRRNFNGDWTITTDAPYEKADAAKVKFVLPLKPREQRKFAYEVTTRLGTNATR